MGLLGGSFNPAHGGHRRLSLRAIAALDLDELWWLVSPQNPLKPRAGMAPLAARLASARAVAGHSRIRPTAIEAALGTVRTVDTLRALRRHYPHLRFVWLMGADNLAQFHRWSEWRAIARLVPIVVLARPGYMGRSHSAPAFGWLRHYLHRDPTGWRDWQLPAIVILNLGLDRRSATAMRRRRPHWAATLTPDHPEDPQA